MAASAPCAPGADLTISWFTLALITSVSVDARFSNLTWTFKTLVNIWKQEINPNESDEDAILHVP